MNQNTLRFTIPLFWNVFFFREQNHVGQYSLNSWKQIEMENKLKQELFSWWSNQVQWSSATQFFQEKFSLPKGIKYIAVYHLTPSEWVLFQWPVNKPMLAGTVSTWLISKSEKQQCLERGIMHTYSWPLAHTKFFCRWSEDRLHRGFSSAAWSYSQLLRRLSEDPGWCERRQ
jgi:hypothetical protein